MALSPHLEGLFVPAIIGAEGCFQVIFHFCFQGCS